MESGEWRVESGKWKVGSGKWRVESGKWEVESGEWKVESGKWDVLCVKFFFFGVLCAGEEADVGGVDEAEADGFGDAGGALVDDAEAAGEVFLAFLDGLVGLAESVADFAGCASGGFEE